DLCRRPATIGLICAWHHDQLADMLHPEQAGDVFVKPGEPRRPPSIPVLYALLSTHRGVHGIMAVGSTSFGPRSPAHDTALVLRDPRSTSAVLGPDDREREPAAPLAVLLELAVRAVRERGAPERRPEGSVAGLASFLHGQLDWLATRPWIAEVWQQLRAVQTHLREVVGDPVPRPVGRCWVLVGGDGRPDPEGAWRRGTALYLHGLRLALHRCRAGAARARAGVRLVMAHLAFEGEEETMAAACAMLGVFSAMALAVLGSLG